MLNLPPDYAWQRPPELDFSGLGQGLAQAGAGVELPMLTVDAKHPTKAYGWHPLDGLRHISRSLGISKVRLVAQVHGLPI
ncbi:hypothetical protein D3C85_1639660 [compost metagenome]